MMSEGGQARAAINCRKKHCRIASAITETNKPGFAVQYGGTASCDTCGKDWAYDREEGQRAMVTPLGVRMRA